jgi:hypothetical protein
MEKDIAHIFLIARLKSPGFIVIFGILGLFCKVITFSMGAKTSA